MHDARLDFGELVRSCECEQCQNDNKQTQDILDLLLPSV